MIKVVLFDFGGVLADEGFKNGLEAIGEKQGVNDIFEKGERLIYETGYVLGLAEERQFWEELRRETGIEGADKELRDAILSRFTLRPEVLSEVRSLRETGLRTAILSDQTNWLDEIDAKDPFYLHFDRVFNSYRMHKGKRDPSLFADVCRELGIKPREALFVDDKPENIRRAQGEGINTIVFNDIGKFAGELKETLEKVASE
jgi:putative hydrolase of the HAD superfamily